MVRFRRCGTGAANPRTMTLSLSLHGTVVVLTALTSGCLGDDSPPGRYDSNGDECPLTAPRGEVALVAYQSDAWVGMDVVSRFQRSTPAREAISCQRRTVGPCEVNACQNLGIDFVNGEPTCGPTSGGDVYVTRGSSPTVRVQGSARLTLDRAFAPGEAFALRTTGGDVPAFAAVVNLPQRVRVTGPEPLLRAGSIPLRAGETFTVTWAPTTSRVLVVVTSNNGGNYTAECSFDGATGIGAIPSGALPEGTGSVVVWSEERNEQRVGVFPVVVRARWGAGAQASIARGQ